MGHYLLYGAPARPGRALGVALFGGSAEYVALWFKSVGHEAYFYWYVALVCAVSFVTALLMVEPRRVTMHD